MAVLRAEGVATPGPFHLDNTAAFIHRMDPRSVHTAATESARTVRVQVITPPAALSREGQKQLVKEVTEIVTKISGDPTQASRTWVILTEAAEGGWGLSGTAFGREEFAALRARAAAAREVSRRSAWLQPYGGWSESNCGRRDFRLQKWSEIHKNTTKAYPESVSVKSACQDLSLCPEPGWEGGPGRRSSPCSRKGGMKPVPSP